MQALEGKKNTAWIPAPPGKVFIMQTMPWLAAVYMSSWIQPNLHICACILLCDSVHSFCTITQPFEHSFSFCFRPNLFSTESLKKPTIPIGQAILTEVSDALESGCQARIIRQSTHVSLEKQLSFKRSCLSKGSFDLGSFEVLDEDDLVNAGRYLSYLVEREGSKLVLTTLINQGSIMSNCDLFLVDKILHSFLCNRHHKKLARYSW